VDPKNTDARIGLASALSGLKQHDEAEKLARAIMAENPKETSAISAVAQALDSAGKFDAAIATYQDALKLAPEDPYLWGNLGWTQYRAEKFDDSIKSSASARTEWKPALRPAESRSGLLGSERLEKRRKRV
jgi:Flp pilus assembly protein TadD